MQPLQNSIDQSNFFNLGQAKWVLGILNLLVAVVGEETLLGLVLRQARSEIASVVREEESTVPPPNHKWFLNN